MKFFSGFSLRDESYLFNDYIDESLYTVCGFSYGAIKALDHVIKELKSGKRVDRLQLFSPAFFQNTDKKFKKLQLMAYTKNKQQYLSQFLKGCFYPYKLKIVQNIQTKKEELEELLYYEWKYSELEALQNKDVIIEVYLGGKDSIVDALASKRFFINHSTVTLVNDANHFLQTK